jgi:hypothetical protein
MAKAKPPWRAVAEIDTAAFVLDFAQNNSDVDSLAEVYDPFKILTDRSKCAMRRS